MAAPLDEGMLREEPEITKHGRCELSRLVTVGLTAYEFCVFCASIREPVQFVPSERSGELEEWTMGRGEDTGCVRKAGKMLAAGALAVGDGVSEVDGRREDCRPTFGESTGEELSGEDFNEEETDVSVDSRELVEVSVDEVRDDKEERYIFDGVYGSSK